MITQKGAMLVETSDLNVAIAAAELGTSALAVRVAKLESVIVAMQAALNAEATAIKALAPSASPSPTATPAPTGGNVYPLTMAVVANPGDPVTIGTGPDQIVLLLANNPSDAPAACSFALLLDGVVIAAPLTVTSFAGMIGGQLFTIKGAWGPLPHTVKFASAGAVGIKDLWINRVSYNFTPLVYNGPTVDARGAMPPPNAASLWDNIGADVSFGMPIAVAAAPPPPPPPPVPVGALPTAPVQAMIAAAASGATIIIPPGVYSGSLLVDKAVTLDGQNQVTFNGTGLAGSVLVRQKGGIVPTANATLQNFKVTGYGLLQSDADLTCGIRPDVGCTLLTLKNLEVYGNQTGLGSGGVPCDVAISNCHFRDNGLPASNTGHGYAHNVYISGVGNVAIVNTDSVTPLGGHAWKVRDPTGILSISNGNHNASDATIIDIPDGAMKPFSINAASFTKGAADANHGVIGYAAEGTGGGLAGGVVSGCSFALACPNPFMLSGGGPLSFDAKNVWSGNKPVAQGAGAGAVTGLPV